MLYDLSTVVSKLEELHNSPLPPIDFNAVWALSSVTSRASSKASYADTVAEADESLAVLHAVRASVDGLIRKAELWRANAAHSLLPVMALPVEVLQTIFAFAIRDDSALNLRLALSLVCRRWRGASVALKSLWSTIVLDGQSNADKYGLFAARAEPLPLTVEVKPCEQNSVFGYGNANMVQSISPKSPL